MQAQAGSAWNQSFNVTLAESSRDVSMTPQSTKALMSGSTPSGRGTDTTPKNTDAMTGVVQDSTTSVEFFGDSSAVSFMRQINAAIDAQLEQSLPSKPGSHDHPALGAELLNPNQQDLIDPLSFTLPPRNFADSLLRDYHDLVWVILPIHDWTVFQAAYDSVWLGQPTAIPERPLYCLINIAFALGSQFSHAVNPTHRNKTGQTFWARAQLLFNPVLQDGASIEAVQCLLMMGLYLQSTCESHQCWMTIGAAVRMAQSLGLYLSSTTPQHSKGTREIEISRRVWHGCVFMDRCVHLSPSWLSPPLTSSIFVAKHESNTKRGSVLSMTFGRPSMIAGWLCNAVPLPMMIDDEYLDLQVEPSAKRPDGKTTAVAFFIKSLELYSIVNDSLLELYMRPGRNSTEGQDRLSSVLQFDGRLMQWADSIPEKIRYVPSKPQDDMVFLRQSIVLRARCVPRHEDCCQG